MFPSSYHGYLTHSELPLIPMKVGCATRANLTMRESDLNSTNATTLNNTVSVSLQKRPQTMYGREYTNKSTMRPLDGLDKSGINRSGVHSSMSSTRPGNSMKITNHIHQNYRRDIPDQPDKEQALQNTFKSVQSHYAELKGLSESYVNFTNTNHLVLVAFLMTTILRNGLLNQNSNQPLFQRDAIQRA
jgi:hypothetical protein